MTCLIHGVLCTTKCKIIQKSGFIACAPPVLSKSGYCLAASASGCVFLSIKNWKPTDQKLMQRGRNMCYGEPQKWVTCGWHLAMTFDLLVFLDGGIWTPSVPYVREIDSTCSRYSENKSICLIGCWFNAWCIQQTPWDLNLVTVNRVLLPWDIVFEYRFPFVHIGLNLDVTF